MSPGAFPGGLCLDITLKGHDELAGEELLAGEQDRALDSWLPDLSAI